MAGARRFWAVMVGAAALLLVNPALAQQAPAAAAPDANAAPDVVRLKNGGLLRGTISELIPGQSVTIVTVAGKTRELPMADVAYAGPAGQEPQAAPQPAPAAPPQAPPAAAAPGEAPGKSEPDTQPYVTVNGRRARLHLESDTPGVTFHRQSGSAVAVSGRYVAMATAYDRLCTAPCQITIPAGTETLALSRPDETPLAAGAATFPAGDSRVVGRFESRSGVRVAGWLIAIGSGVGGLALVATSFGSKRECSSYDDSCYDSPDLDITKLIVGTVIASVGMPVGIVMAMTRDVAKVDVRSATRGAPALPPAPGLLLSGTL